MKVLKLLRLLQHVVKRLMPASELLDLRERSRFHLVTVSDSSDSVTAKRSPRSPERIFLDQTLFDDEAVGSDVAGHQALRKMVKDDVVRNAK